MPRSKTITTNSNLTPPREWVELWRPPDLAQVELRRGFAVARPVPRHWHEEYQLCLIQTGAGEIHYRGSHLPTPPASLFLVHPGEPHSNRSFDEWGCSFRGLYVEPELMQQAAAEVQDKATSLPFFPTAVVFEEEVIQQYLTLYAALEQSASSLERQSLLLRLLTDLIVRYAAPAASAKAVGKERQAVKRACEYLQAHSADNVSLETLARLANLSPYHFHRVFAAQMGMPPHAYQTQLRVTRAKALLRAGWAIPQVAAHTGFADQSHLNRHFKRLIGIPPGQYRQNSKIVQDVLPPLG